MQEVNVCHITTVHRPFDPRIFDKQCRTISKAGYRVSLIAPNDKNEMVDSIDIVPIPQAKNRLMRMIVSTLSALLQAHKVKAEIYHVHDPELLMAGVLLKLLTGKKIIYDVHEDYAKQMLSKEYIPSIARKSVAAFTKIAERLLSGVFDGVVAATDDILKNFSHMEKAVTVSNFPRLDNYVSKERIGDRHKKVFDIVYFGGLSRIKGLSNTAEALDLIESGEEVRLTLCGSFDPPEYEAEIMQSGGSGKIRFLGWQDLSTIRELMFSADIGVICFLPEPNHVKAVPNKLFEYMAAGLPVIASNFSLWKDYVEGNGCGICVNPQDPQEIAGAIGYLIDRPALRQKMGERGRKACREKYNWENEGRKLLRLYAQVGKTGY
jgi:glycosyltransferase involved in cell wall biosynthesis